MRDKFSCDLLAHKPHPNESSIETCSALTPLRPLPLAVTVGLVAVSLFTLVRQCVPHPVSSSLCLKTYYACACALCDGSPAASAGHKSTISPRTTQTARPRAVGARSTLTRPALSRTRSRRPSERDSSITLQPPLTPRCVPLPPPLAPAGRQRLFFSSRALPARAPEFGAGRPRRFLNITAARRPCGFR